MIFNSSFREFKKKKNLKSVNEMNNHGQCLCAEFSTEKKQAASSAVGKKKYE